MFIPTDLSKELIFLSNKKKNQCKNKKYNIDTKMSESKILRKLESPTFIFISFIIIFFIVILPFLFLDFSEDDIVYSKNNKSYTVSQIDINEYLYGIGKTKPEYIVAKYNKSYDDVTIFNNNKKSDGIVGINIDSSPSQIFKHPFEKHKDTLKYVDINEGIISLSSDSVENGLFNDCQSLIEIKLPNTLKEIGDGTFNNCSALQDIKLPNSIEKIGNLAFDNCENLSNINLSSKLKEMGIYCFRGCINLSEIRIPSSLNEISGGAFEECTNLTTVFIPKEIKRIREFAFCAIGEDAIIYCETEEVKQLFRLNYNYDGSTNIVVDKTKFN